MEITREIKPIVVGKVDNTSRKVIAVGYDAFDNLVVIVAGKGEKVSKRQARTLDQLMKHVPLGITLDTKKINNINEK